MVTNDHRGGIHFLDSLKYPQSYPQG
jgi:hypothetical protein